MNDLGDWGLVGKKGWYNMGDGRDEGEEREREMGMKWELWN